MLLYGSTCYCLCGCNALQTVGLGLGLALEAADTVKLTHDTPGPLVTGSQPSPHLTQTHNPPTKGVNIQKVCLTPPAVVTGGNSLWQSLFPPAAQTMYRQQSQERLSWGSIAMDPEQWRGEFVGLPWVQQLEPFKSAWNYGDSRMVSGIENSADQWQHKNGGRQSTLDVSVC